MPKIKLKTDDFKCSKCGHQNGQDGILLDRHHRMHQRFIIRVLLGQGKTRTDLYKRLKRDYGKFLPEDISLLCPSCHEEIHERYFDVTYRLKHKFRRHVYDFTIPQLKELMREYEREFYAWTNGVQRVGSPKKKRKKRKR